MIAAVGSAARPACSRTLPRSRSWPAWARSARQADMTGSISAHRASDRSVGYVRLGVMTRIYSASYRETAGRARDDFVTQRQTVIPGDQMPSQTKIVRGNLAVARQQPQ